MSLEELGIYEGNYRNKCLIDSSKLFKIYTANNIEEKRDCYLKIYDKEALKSKNFGFMSKFIEREIKITELCNSKYTINFHKRMESKNSIILEFEIHEEDLCSFMEDNGKLGDNDIIYFKQIIKDLAKALKVIHQKGVMHRNIQPINIFINNIDDENRIIKLGNFENAIMIKDNKSEQVGTLLYAAPEIIQNLEYDEKCDLWSLGVTLYELYFGNLPYGVNVNKNIIMNSLFNYYDGKGFYFQKTGKASLDILFNGLLQIEPKNRISFNDFFNLVFDKDFMENDDKSLDKIENYKGKYEAEEIKEANNIEEKKKQNLEKVISFALQDDLTNIMDFPKGEISKEEKFHNVLYYNEDLNFIES